ncbi:cobalamin-binding protein [Zobellella maritima]|uniref:cobalamin-binding protein n=1 Tax=Zobellella maritima TaxID=2059725 RepID=UPI000E304078|nr:cobalamin-binding protein [Zobellella maritima]
MRPVTPKAASWLPSAGLLLLLAQPVTADEARRIISLTPHITEMLYAIGAGEQIVATDAASDYPAEARALPKVANFRSLHLEQILALQPDLVIAWRSAQALQVQPLENLGIPVAFSEPKTLQSLADELEYLGELTGHREQARAVAQDYRQQLTQLEAEYSHKTPVTVFYQLGYPPLMSVNDHTWMGQAVRLCGGTNILADSPIPYPQVGTEFVLMQDPQVILGETTGQLLSLWQQWPELRAVRHGQLWPVDTVRLHRFTPRTPAGIRDLCETLETARQGFASAP